MTSLSDRAGFLIVANLIKYAVGFVTPIVLVRDGNFEETVQVFRIYVWLLPLYVFVRSPIPQIFGQTIINLHVNLVAMAVRLALLRRDSPTDQPWPRS